MARPRQRAAKKAEAALARMAAILRASGSQSSSRSMADQIASTSSITRVSGRSGGAAAARPGGGGNSRRPSIASAQAAVS